MPSTKAVKLIRAIRNHDALLEATTEALCWLDPDCKSDGIKETEDMSDREKMLLSLYKIITQAEGK